MSHLILQVWAPSPTRFCVECTGETCEGALLTFYFVMGRTRLSQRRSEAARNRSRQLTNLQDGANKLERRVAEKNIARMISRHALIVPATQKYGLPRGKFEEVFNSFATQVYDDLNVSAGRVKTLVYRYYLKDKNDSLPPIADDDVLPNDADVDPDNDVLPNNADVDPDEVSLLCSLGGFYKTLF